MITALAAQLDEILRRGKGNEEARHRAEHAGIPQRSAFTNP
jgi:hypothetical protein